MRPLAACALLALVSSACSSSADSTKTTAGRAAGDITLTGCVQPTDRATPEGKTADTKYMLINAKESESELSRSTAGTSGSAAGSPATMGTAGRMGATVSATTYQLDASDATIEPEVGHVVEIVAPAPERDASNAAPKLKVQTITFVAEACTAK